MPSDTPTEQPTTAPTVSNLSTSNMTNATEVPVEAISYKIEIFLVYMKVIADSITVYRYMRLRVSASLLVVTCVM